MKKILTFLLAIFIFIGFFSCTEKKAEKVVKKQDRITRSYKGHENDIDAINLVKKYPKIAGTRLDNCQTCHRGGIENTDTKRIYNSCDYCHLIPFPNKKYKTGVPQNYNQTLNEFGRAYMNAGRTVQALEKVAAADTDKDGFTNDEELKNDRYPGSSFSKPDQPLTPFIVISEEQIIKMEKHHQFLMLNHTRHSTDEYIDYIGVKVKDLLENAGVDLTNATGITTFAPDGFSIDFSIEDILNPFPEAQFYDFRNNAELAKTLVEYSPKTSAGLKHEDKLTDPLWLIVALERDGNRIKSAYFNKKKGHIEGAGPFRIVAPQLNPGHPDRGIKVDKFGDGWDFDEGLDHNAGRCIRGMCVIRINPLPEGYEEYDWRNGWSLIQDKKIVIYGDGVPVK